MNTPYQWPETDRQIVYVKAVDVASLPKDVQDKAGELQQLYAVHDAHGQQLALVADRRMAFVLARQNDMQPVTVH